MIYLDNAATTFPKPACVYEAMDAAARSGIGNPGRAGHRLALASEKIVANCRNLLNELLHGAGHERFAFTLNCTDALNLAIKGILSPGDHVVAGALEHNSVGRPLASFARRNGPDSVTWVASDNSGRYRPADFAKAIGSKTRLVVISHASNVTGRVQPIEEISKICQGRGVPILVDAAQTVGCVPIDLIATGIDLLAAPGHKGLFGPSGTGFLYVRPGLAIEPWREGGTGGDAKRPGQPPEMPMRLEAGTPNVVGLAGLAAGIGFVQEQGVDAIYKRELQLAHAMLDGLHRIPGVTLLNRWQDEPQIGIALFAIRDMDPVDTAAILDQSFDICVRPGLHCNPGTHQSLWNRADGAIRASLSALNVQADSDALLNAVRQIAAG